jgi:hypothetical protein
MTQRKAWNLVVNLTNWPELLHEGDKVSNRKVCLVMRYVDSHRAARNVHLSSDRWRSMLPRWHKIWCPVNAALMAAADADKQGSASRRA